MAPRITLRTVIGHMQHMEQTLLRRINEFHGDVKGDIRVLQTQVGFLQEGVRNIDKRLDDIELQFLPGRIRRLEMKTFGRTFRQ